MRLAGFEGGAQRFARAEQVLLAYDIIEGTRAELLGERRSRRLRRIFRPGEKISPLNFNPLAHPPLWAG
jgi:hypothetical protein